MRTNKDTGRLGEDIAVACLEQLGFEILDRNWYGPGGELDVVAYEPARDAVVGVEVKTRRGTGFGSPAEAVTPSKVRRMRGLLARWLAEHPVHADEVRLDLLAVDLRDGRAPRVEHLVGIC
ncbi:YraN family protein [Cellulomonas hominis]|uniref:YraN family protein n=1 Tax=Cellulomonas hominis TaxID=156981 RepID=UPI001C107168|nr:YraN family protein [Cellulomonas hominis]MBU5422753.1 YraN family protein [Cellulomonas hominis]